MLATIYIHKRIVIGAVTRRFLHHVDIGVQSSWIVDGTEVILETQGHSGDRVTTLHDGHVDQGGVPEHVGDHFGEHTDTGRRMERDIGVGLVAETCRVLAISLV